MTIAEILGDHLAQVRNFLNQVSEAQYTQPRRFMEGSSIGQHTRHALEFCQCILQGANLGLVCYDNRTRSLIIENSPGEACRLIGLIKEALNQVETDKALIFQANFSLNPGENMALSTSLYRELAYAFEHSIHHFSMIRMALIADHSDLECRIGLAPSTARHRKLCAQ